MDYDDYSLDERPSWGVVSPREGGGDLGVVRDTLRKEQVLKLVFFLFQTAQIIKPHIPEKSLPHKKI
uniref:Uncharacterized protein n=1 Tax=Psilocybe cubensis TaxID=181762 RepID=A0A8H7XZF7_PSICU